LAAAFLEANLVYELILYVAPHFLEWMRRPGGSRGLASGAG